MRAQRAYRRARSERAAKAVQDPKLMDHLTGAAAAVQQAVVRLAGAPEPPPRRRPLRTAAFFGAAVGLAVLAAYVDSRSA